MLLVDEQFLGPPLFILLGHRGCKLRARHHRFHPESGDRGQQREDDAEEKHIVLLNTRPHVFNDIAPVIAGKRREDDEKTHQNQPYAPAAFADFNVHHPAPSMAFPASHILVLLA